jgi:hypothetical protein
MGGPEFEDMPETDEYLDDDYWLPEDEFLDQVLEPEKLINVAPLNLKGGPTIGKMLGIDDTMGDDYVEEHMDANGHAYRKEVHKGDGWTSVSIQAEGGANLGSMGGDPIGEIMGGMIQQIMQA